MEKQLDRIAAAFESIAEKLEKISQSIESIDIPDPASRLDVKAWVQLENEPNTKFGIRIDDDTRVQIINETLYNGFGEKVKQFPFKVTAQND